MAALFDRAPPEIEPGVTIADLQTVEACDAALDRLMMSITSIEAQLKRPAAADPSDDWRVRAKQALRIKGFMMPRLQERRAELKRQVRHDRAQDNMRTAREATKDKRRILLGIAWEHEPEAMRRVEAVAHELHPELFNDGEVA